MRRIALLSLMTVLGGCGSKTMLNVPFSTGSNPNLPMTGSVNMDRVTGQGVAVSPLNTEPGDIWPGPLPPPRTLQDLERRTPGTGRRAAPTNVPMDRAGNPLLAPLPYPTPTPAAPAGGTAARPAPSGPAQPPVDRRIVVPNGNGTSTVIHPDGRIETIPTPK